MKIVLIGIGRPVHYKSQAFVDKKIRHAGGTFEIFMRLVLIVIPSNCCYFSCYLHCCRSNSDYYCAKTEKTTDLLCKMCASNTHTQNLVKSSVLYQIFGFGFVGTTNDDVEDNI